MKTQTDKAQEPQNSITPRVASESSNRGTVQLKDDRTSSLNQRKLRLEMERNNKSKNPIQRKTSPERPALSAIEGSRKNNTGLPDTLKSGIENLSGYSMDDVKVHYNSSKPAQLQAHAYAQGTDIHLAPGQEKHLPHEAWHVVQQKQGRVKPTRQLKSKVNINDDVGLEKEADVMGVKSLQVGNDNNRNRMHKKAKPRTSQEKKEKLRTDRNVLGNIHPTTVQRLSKAERGAIKWGLIGTFATPIVGTAIGGLIGHARGKQEDLNDLMNAYPAITLADLNVMTQAGASTYRIRNQLNTINGNNVAHLVQLYNRGARPKDITNLLRYENNGGTLDNLLGLEQNNDARKILRLYRDGINSIDMMALLGVESNGQTVHNYYTNVVRGCTVQNIQFGSQNPNGNFGSIYFPFGRIRLTHPNDPIIEPHAPGFIERATFNNNDLNVIKGYFRNNVRTGQNTWLDMYNMATGLQSYRLAVAGVGGTLVEFYNPGWHPSRGTPVAFPQITQNELNIIANVADLNNSAALRNWMNAIQNLAVIPIN